MLSCVAWEPLLASPGHPTFPSAALVYVRAQTSGDADGQKWDRGRRIRRGSESRACLPGRPRWRLTTGRQPTGENEPTPHERLPPRETRTELRRTTAPTLELHGQRNALEIERCNPALPPLPTNADQEMRTRTGRVGKPATPDSPKESYQLTLAFPERSGRAADEKQGA